MRRWLSRLSFSFLIVAAVLFWDAWKAQNGQGRALSKSQMQVEYAAAGVCLALGLIGARERHRPARGDDERRL